MNDVGGENNDVQGKNYLRNIEDQSLPNKQPQKCTLLISAILASRRFSDLPPQIVVRLFRLYHTYLFGSLHYQRRAKKRIQSKMKTFNK